MNFKYATIPLSRVAGILFASKQPLSMECPRPSTRQWQTIGNGFLREVAMKRCSKCGIWKLFLEFSKSKREKDGLNFWCKSCINFWKKEHASRSIYDPEYYKRNKEKRLEHTKRWQRSNREHVREKNRAYQHTHQAEVYKAIQRWRKANPEKRKEYGRNRYALEKGARGKVTAIQFQKLKEKYNFTCLCCGRKEPEIKITHDHVKPLAIGGENTIENSQPLCRSCNCRKGKKWIDYR